MASRNALTFAMYRRLADAIEQAANDLATRESLCLLQAAVDPAAEEALFIKAYQSQDFAEGVSAFQHKRKPNWVGG